MFIKLNQPVPGNRDIIEALGMEYVEPDYSPKKKSTTQSQEFLPEALEAAD